MFKLQWQGIAWDYCIRISSIVPRARQRQTRTGVKGERSARLIVSFSRLSRRANRLRNDASSGCSLA